MDDIFNDPFHMIAFSAFIQEAKAVQGWPDSEKVRQAAYREYESVIGLIRPSGVAGGGEG